MECDRQQVGTLGDAVGVHATVARSLLSLFIVLVSLCKKEKFFAVDGRHQFWSSCQTFAVIQVISPCYSDICLAFRFRGGAWKSSLVTAALQSQRMALLCSSDRRHGTIATNYSLSPFPLTFFPFLFPRWRFRCPTRKARFRSFESEILGAMRRNGKAHGATRARSGNTSRETSGRDLASHSMMTASSGAYPSSSHDRRVFAGCQLQLRNIETWCAFRINCCVSTVLTKHPVYIKYYLVQCVREVSSS